jgi:L-gulono-1,4-lactone dehydrogenase
MWRNWSGEQVCRPALVERPGSVGEVSAALERAAAAARTVRVAGSGHSFTDLVPTDGHLLDLRRMDRVLDVDRAGGLARVEAGITLRALNERLAEHALGLENLGDIDAQTLAGAIATATHGTGAHYRNLSAQVEAIELVTGDGRRLELTAAGDPDALRAARVSVGALGVVTAVTLRCVPAFTLHGIDEPRPLEETLDGLDELVAAHDHFELFTFPYSPLALTRRSDHTDRSPAPRGRARAYAEDVLLQNRAFGLFCRAGRRAPRLVPRLNRAVSRLAGRRERVEESHRIFASPRHVRFVEMEYALPRAAAAQAVRRVRARIEERRLPVNFPIELRFVAADDAFLSPATGRDTAYVAVHVFAGMAWAELFGAVEQVMDELGGRPHWGKRHFQTAATLAPRYPDWDRFAAVRAWLDPDGRFANAGIERVLGPVTESTAPRPDTSGPRRPHARLRSGRAS